MQNIYKIIRDFLLRFASKEFLIFCFFMFVSTAFWLLSSLNESYDQEFSISINITDVPENVVMTENISDTVKVTLHDKGYELLRYVMSDIPAITLKFSQYAKHNGSGNVPISDINKLIKARIAATTTLVSVKVDRLDFFYLSHGQKKRVPVLFDGTIDAKSGYYISNTSFSPDSVTIFASKGALDTINAIYTVPQRIDELTEPMTTLVKLQHIRGAKSDIQEVKLSINTDQLTEITVSVPIKAINVPEGMDIKTFPSRIDVKVSVGMRLKDRITAETFNVVADYMDLQDVNSDNSEKIPIKLIASPKGIARATLVANSVDYLIEK